MQHTQNAAYQFTLAELESLPTLTVGQADDLKVENMDEGVRVWLSRCGVEDGEPFDNKVTVERRDEHGIWRDHEIYQAS